MFLHRQLGPTPEAIYSLPIISLLHAVEITMWTPQLRYLPILLHLLHHIYFLTSSLGLLGPSMQVCLAIMFFAMLRQSNLASATPSKIDPSRHTCRGDIISAPKGLLILVRWTKSLQLVGRVAVLPIPEVSGYHPVF